MTGVGRRPSRGPLHREFSWDALTLNSGRRLHMRNGLLTFVGFSPWRLRPAWLASGPLAAQTPAAAAKGLHRAQNAGRPPRPDGLLQCRDHHAR